MKKFYLLIVILIAIGAAVGVYYTVKNWNPNPLEPVVFQDFSRKEVVKDILDKISDISPVKAVLGGNWYVTRFWFIKDSNKDVYVEYEDGHNLRQILLEAKKNGDMSYKVVGYFEPGETSWDLKEGEDKFFGSLLELYEYDSEIEAWVKQN